MRQHTVHDEASVHYVDGLESIWDSWEPWLRQTERLFHVGAYQLRDDDSSTDLLRQAQYRVHTAAEFAGALDPPILAAAAHDQLVGSLHACRDTLGALAERADSGELDEQTTEIGLHAVLATRSAFQGARISSEPMTTLRPSHLRLLAPSEHPRRRDAGTLVFSALLLVCAVLGSALLLELRSMS